MNFTRGFNRERERERRVIVVVVLVVLVVVVVKLVSLELLYFYDALWPLKNYYTTLLLFSNNQLFHDICALRYFGDSSTFFLSPPSSFLLSFLSFFLSSASKSTRGEWNESRQKVPMIIRIV